MSAYITVLVHELQRLETQRDKATCSTVKIAAQLGIDAVKRRLQRQRAAMRATA